MVDHSQFFAMRDAPVTETPFPEPCGRPVPHADARTSGHVVVVERRPFVRECLVRSLSAETNWTVAAFGTLAGWQDAPKRVRASLIVLSIGADPLRGAGDTVLLKEIAADTPVAVMADSEAPSAIMAALDLAVRGYIPTSLPLNVAVEALRLVRAGGIYVPAGCLIASHGAKASAGVEKPREASQFTLRQRDVIECLRTGKANKIIAHELNMRESTVKVHVRNIMRKLKARNRTEVAYLANARLANGAMAPL